MKRFQQFLKEAKMTPAEALKILGLNAGYSADDLKVAYRKAAIEAHPDRAGGSTTKMQDVNNAKDVLDKTVSKNSAGVNQSPDEKYKQWQRDREDSEAKADVFRKIAWDAFDTHYKAHAFTEHFTKVFGQPFTVKEMKRKNTEYGHSVTYAAEWFNSDRSIVLDLQISVHFEDLYKKPMLSMADAEGGLSVSLSTTILHNRKKVKLTQRDYKFTNSYDVLKNPEVTFPAKKMVTQSAKAANRAMSKRDILLTFASELDARGDAEWMYVPVGDYVVSLHRMTFMRSGSWGIYDVATKRGGGRLASPKGYFSFLETEPDEMTTLLDGLKALQSRGKGMTPQEISDMLESLMNAGKAKRAQKRPQA